jgi:hypothetical protein
LTARRTQLVGGAWRRAQKAIVKFEWNPPTKIAAHPVPNSTELLHGNIHEGIQILIFIYFLNFFILDQSVEIQSNEVKVRQNHLLNSFIYLQVLFRYEFYLIK